MIPNKEPPKFHKKDKNAPLVMVPAVLPSTAMFYPTNVNLQQFYCLPQNIELAKIIQMNAQLSLMVSNNGGQYFTPPPPLSKDERSPTGYDVTDTPLLSFRSHIKDHMHDLTKIALQGCDLGENIALSHQKRPCFKKIDSLCARLKQDLLRSDNVVANINSQGVAWAIKDFIFVFTRIINAWIIIKDYANNQSEGLNKVRSAYSPNFYDSFEKWQDSTIDFIDQIIKSFASLDDLVQSQRTNYAGSKEDYNTSNSSNGDSLNDLTSPKSKRDDEPVLINSEFVQVKHSEAGTYLKTGVYDPLLKRNAVDSLKDAPLDDMFQNYHECINKLCKREFQLCDKEEKRGLDFDDYTKMSILKTIWTQDLFPQDYNWDCYLLQMILNLKEGQYFFTSQFMENYFPNFIKHVPNFIDLRTIVFKLQLGEYKDVHEVVHDLRQIVYSANFYLTKQSNALMSKSLSMFELELDNMLSGNIFSGMNFDHITGGPNDVF